MLPGYGHPSPGRAEPPASVLTPLIERDGKRGLVVADMTDVDGFTHLAPVTIPDGPAYLVDELDRGSPGPTARSTRAPLER